MLLKSVLAGVALPPMSFLYLAIIGALIGPRHRRSGRALVWAGLTGLVLLGLPVVSDTLIVSLERNLPLTPPPNAMPEAIVVLGGDVWRTNDVLPSRPGYLTLDRLRMGADLRRRTGLPILVTGGIVRPDLPPVARVMADSLRDDFQAPVALVEAKSNDTWENAAFSAEILKNRGIRSVYVVTHAWHMRRAVLAFRKAGLTVTAAPTSLDTISGSVLTDYLPRISAWQDSYFAFHEWVGCAWYALR